MTSATLSLVEAPVEADLFARLEASVPPPACEHRTKRSDPRCGKPASWLLVLSCGHSGYACAEHRASTEAVLARGRACRTHGKPPAWRFEAIA